MSAALPFALLLPVVATASAQSTPASIQSTPAAAQSAPIPAFEVASVKPALHQPPGSGGAPRSGGNGSSPALGPCPTSLKLDPAQVDIRCANLPMLIGYAYRFPPDRIQGRAWLQSLGSPRFDVVAKLPPGAAKTQVPEMLRSLLAARFHLVLHRTVLPQPVYALIAARGGILMPAAAAPAPTSADASNAESPPPALSFYGATQDETVPNPKGGGTITTLTSPKIGIVTQFDTPDLMQRWESPAIGMEGLADLLDKIAPLPLPIVDQTGLRGRYQLTLRMSINDLLAGAREARAADPAADTQDSVLRVINDSLRKLGLQLQRRMAPLDVLVVDSLDKMPTVN